MNRENIDRASSEAALTSFRWSVDHFALTEEGTLLVFGWAVHDRAEIDTMSVIFRFSDESSQSIDIVYGTERDDVFSAIPDNSRARTSGFYFFGQTCRTDVVSMSLEARLNGGPAVMLPTNCSMPKPGTCLARNEFATRRATYGRLARRAWSFIRSGRYRDLFAVAQRYLAGSPRMTADGFEKIRGMLATTDRCELIIDHDLGGGANHFRDALIRSLKAAGSAVLLLSFHVPTLRYVIEFRARQRTVRYAVDLNEFASALGDLSLQRIHYNNTVSFPNQLAVLDMLSSVCRKGDVPMTFYMHDFHCICPSHFLLDDSGRYCDLPDTRKCHSCLKNINDGLISLYRERDILLWRRRWLSLLSKAEELVFFSESSKSLLFRAYPQLIRHPGLIVRPHDLSDFSSASIKVDFDGRLNIGVIGRINLHKGAGIVEQMVDSIESQGLDAKVTILGSLDSRSTSPILHVTGSYQRDELPGLIQKHRINLIAFTSIWPETYSFVTAEIMKLGLPIICFDLGAPAERVKGYSLGRVIALSDGRALVDAAVSFHRDLGEQFAENAQSNAMQQQSNPFPKADGVVMEP